MGPIRDTRPVPLVVALSAMWVAGASPVAGQDGRGATTAFQSARQTWSPPLTRFGHPDLQGVWVNKRATPSERPATLEGRQSLTDAEVAELEQPADRIFWGGGSDLVIGDRLFLTALDNPGRFINPNGANRSSAYMVEREFDTRTSLIVDPVDGRIPELTPVARQRRAEERRRATTLTGPESFHNRTRCITQGVRGSARALAATPSMATTRSFRRLTMSCSCWKHSTTRASFPWMDVRLCPRVSATGTGTHEDDGMDTRS